MVAPVFEVSVQKVLDRMPHLQEQMRELSKISILVGVTQETSVQGVAQGEVNNAVKAYLNDNGAPELNIPQREFLRPGVEAVEDQVVEYLADAADALFSDDGKRLQDSLDRAGLTARNGVVDEIDSGPLNPGTRTLSPVTIALRKSGRWGTRQPRDSEEPLVESGALRQSITYAIETP